MTGAIDRYLSLAAGASSDVSQLMADIITYDARGTIDNVNTMEKEIFANRTDLSAVDRKLHWFGNMTEYMNLVISKVVEYLFHFPVSLKTYAQACYTS